MRNNKYQSKSSHAGMFSTAGVSSLQPCRFKIVPGSFCEDSVFLDLVLHFLMHGQFWLHHSTRSGSFCRGLELFCSSVEVIFFGLVVMPRIVEGAVRAAVTLMSSIVGWGCFFASVNGVGLFLCSSSGVGLFCSTRCGVGLFCSGFSVGCVKPFVGHANLIRCIYWRLGERRDGAVSRVVFVIFLCSLYCVTKTVLCCYALGI